MNVYVYQLGESVVSVHTTPERAKKAAETFAGEPLRWVESNAHGLMWFAERRGRSTARVSEHVMLADD